MRCNKFKLIQLFLFLVLGSTAFAQKENMLPEDFSEGVLEHVKNIVSFSPRLAGTENERKAGEYVEETFESLGLNTQVEQFFYDNFEFEDLTLRINRDTLKPMGLGFIPYNHITEFSDTALIVDSGQFPEGIDKEDFFGKPIISNDFANHFKLLLFQPSLIIYMDSAEFAPIKHLKKIYFELSIQGNFIVRRSQNIIAQLRSPNLSDKEIIVGAHVDSYRISPGASDNASGVGVMIELARYLKSMESKLNYNIKFIVFGAEEIGILGSRQYVLANPQLKQKCILFYNIDDVGGNGLGAIENLGGIFSPPPELNDSLSILLAKNPWEGNPDYWRGLLTPYIKGFLTSVNHPDWLVSVTESALESSGYKLNFARNLGGDEMSFSHAGIPSTSIGITCDHPHTPWDNIERINESSLRKAGEISIRVLLNTNNIIPVDGQLSLRMQK